MIINKFLGQILAAESCRTRMNPAGIAVLFLPRKKGWKPVRKRIGKKTTSAQFTGSTEGRNTEAS